MAKKISRILTFKRHDRDLFLNPDEMRWAMSKQFA
jgi:hypothetical protein